MTGSHQSRGAEGPCELSRPRLGAQHLLCVPPGAGGRQGPVCGSSAAPFPPCVAGVGREAVQTLLWDEVLQMAFSMRKPRQHVFNLKSWLLF